MRKIVWIGTIEHKFFHYFTLSKKFKKQFLKNIKKNYDKNFFWCAIKRQTRPSFVAGYLQND